jgi:hypothetical protein
MEARTTAFLCFLSFPMLVPLRGEEPAAPLAVFVLTSRVATLRISAKLILLHR